MGKVIYLMNVSLDGIVEGPNGRFDWTYPDAEILRFHSQLARAVGGIIYGRRMYETMAVWQDLVEDGLSDEMVEYGRIWRSKPKLVFSTSLPRVGQDCRLARGNLAEEVDAFKKQVQGDVAVSGPGIAGSFARLGLVDEYQMVMYPVIVGGGKPFLPKLETLLPLKLLETRKFPRGEMYLRYERA